MKNIELYKEVILIKDFEIIDVEGRTTTYKKGLTGVAIDFCNDKNYVIVEIDSKEYKDNIPALPIELLEYL